VGLQSGTDPAEITIVTNHTTTGALPLPPYVGAARDASVDAFIRDLRKFILNRHLEATLAGKWAVGESPSASLSTEVTDLLAWEGWSADGGAFLATIGPAEPLDVALTPYKRQVVDFCAWLGKWQAAVYRGALEELADLERGHRGTPIRRAAVVQLPPQEEALVPESWLEPRRLVHV
jgi:hypothetical protein